MAIDSRNKRSSAIHVSLPWRGMFPLPDGSFSAADRMHAAFMYRGIMDDDSSVASTWLEYTAPWRNPEFTTCQRNPEFTSPLGR